MKEVTISARCGKGEGAPQGSITVMHPENIEEAIQVYGAEAVLSNALANWTVTVQSALRSRVSKGVLAEQIQAELGPAKMGATTPRITSDPTSRIKADWDKIPADIKETLLAELKAKLVASR